jgi:hypothetical protein
MQKKFTSSWCGGVDVDAKEESETAEDTEIEPGAKHGREHAATETGDHQHKGFPVGAVGNLQMSLFGALAAQPEHRRTEPKPQTGAHNNKCQQALSNL